MKLCRTVHCRERRTLMAEIVYFSGWKTRQQSELTRGQGSTQYRVAKDLLSSAPFVSMVQAAYLRNGNDTTILRPIDGSRLRGVFRQG